MTNLRGPLFLWLTIIGILYLSHANYFGLCDFLQKNDLPPVVFILWLFTVLYMLCNERKS